MTFQSVEGGMRKRQRANMPKVPRTAEEAVLAMEEVPAAYKRHFQSMSKAAAWRHAPHMAAARAKVATPSDGV